jgi:hypothetical protein
VREHYRHDVGSTCGVGFVANDGDFVVERRPRGHPHGLHRARRRRIESPAANPELESIRAEHDRYTVLDHGNRCSGHNILDERLAIRPLLTAAP